MKPRKRLTIKKSNQHNNCQSKQETKKRTFNQKVKPTKILAIKNDTYKTTFNQNMKPKTSGN